MKKIALCLPVLLAACQNVPVQTPAQISAEVCPAVTATVSALKADQALSPTIQADLAKASPVIAGVCTAGQTVDTSSLQAMASTGFPLLISAAQAYKAAPSLVDNMIAAQAVFTTVLAVQAGAQTQVAK